MTLPAKPAVLSLQDVVSHLKATCSPECGDLLTAADLIKHYFKQPFHEISIDALRERHRYFGLYLSFLRMPEEEIALFYATASKLIAKAEALEGTRIAKLPGLDVRHLDPCA